MAVTKRRILTDLHEQLAEEKRRMSRDRCGRIPEPGWEIPFMDTEKKMEMIRDMMRGLEEKTTFSEIEEFAEKNKEALKNPFVRARIREWQRQVMAGEPPSLEDLKLDGGREDVHTL